MNEEEARKICASCGADVTHHQRYKNRRGEYLCRACRSKGKRSRHRGSIERRLQAVHRDVESLRRELEHVDAKVSYVLAAAGMGILVVVLRWLIR